MFKFLHTADVHLDSPMKNVRRYDGAPYEALIDAPRRAFGNVIDVAISEQVKFVLISGDLYDGDCDDFQTPRHFRQKMELLRQHGIRAYIIQGNHDAQSGLTKSFRLQLPDNVHLFPTSKPATAKIEELGIAIHGMGFAQRIVTEDLSKQYPDAVPGMVNIGMLHTSCGQYELHDTYAPSNIPSLTSKGYDYWALGHIHKPTVLSGPSPWIVYPGNPQGRSVKEAGPRGCVVVTVNGDLIKQRRVETDVVRWYECNVDTSDCPDALSIMPRIRDAIQEKAVEPGQRTLAIRLILTGRCAAHGELLRQSDYWDSEIRTSVMDHFDERAWIEKIRFQTESVPVGDAKVNLPVDSAVGELVDQLSSADLGHAASCELQAEFEKMLSVIPTNPRVDRDEIELDDERQLSSLIRESQELLVARLIAGEPL